MKKGRALSTGPTRSQTPCFNKTKTGRALERLCEHYQIGLRWHCGLVLSVAAVPADFRGPSMPSLAERIATSGQVDAADIGRAAMELARDPSAWVERGSPAATLQQLKLMWHVLVRFGRSHASRCEGAAEHG